MTHVPRIAPMAGARVADALEAAREQGDDSAPAPMGPVTNVLRLRTDRRRAIARLRAEARAPGG